MLCPLINKTINELLKRFDVLLTNATRSAKHFTLFKINSGSDTSGMLMSGQGLLIAIAGCITGLLSKQLKPINILSMILFRCLLNKCIYIYIYIYIYILHNYKMSTANLHVFTDTVTYLAVLFYILIR